MNETSQEDAPFCRELHASVFDAIPSAIFVVKADLSIEDFNDAAIRLPEDVLSTTVAPDWSGDRIGDVLGCLNATAGCCNSPLCKDCGFIKGIENQTQPTRKLISITHRKNGKLAPLEYFMTSVPLRHGAELMSIIILDSKENWSPEILKSNTAASG